MEKKKIFFVGIGGIGTSALAQWCYSQGDEVLGSNNGKTDIFGVLKQKGIKIFSKHSEKNLPTDTDVLVYSEAVPLENPERKQAKKLNIPQKSYFEYLGICARNFNTIAVTGAHGKTTTTGLLARGFLESDFSLTTIVGSKLPFFQNSNFGAGSNDWLLVEACEYRNNFQFLNPEIVVLTNVELDHVDFYQSEDIYIQTFQKFCQKAKTVIFHAGDEKTEKVLQNFSGERIAVKKNDWENLEVGIPGIHNRKNAALAIACAQRLGLDISSFKVGIKAYQGAWRRQEFLGIKTLETKSIQVFDDYGHHPTEIIATIQAFREKFPNQKIGLIFEPHQYSRTRQFFSEFEQSFTKADFVGLFPIYEARDSEEDKAAVSIDDFVKKNPQHFQAVSTISEVFEFAKNLGQNDILLFMGAGNISELAREFMKK